MNKQDKNKFQHLAIALSDASYQCGMSTKLSLEEYYHYYEKYEESLANLYDFAKDFDRLAPVTVTIEQPKMGQEFVDKLLEAMKDIGAAEGIGYELTRKESPKPAKQNEASAHEKDEKLTDELKKKLLSLNSDEFAAFVSELRLPRCIHCSTMRNGRPCYCQNDE
jgi:hypothetical protein